MALDAGVMAVCVEFAQNLKDCDWFGRQDPYCILTCGSQKYRTRTAKDAGRNPVWNETFRFNVVNENEVELLLKDEDVLKDDIIGTARINLARAREQGSDKVSAPVASRKGGKQHGFVSVSLTFTSNSSLKPGQPQAHAHPQAPQQAPPYYTQHYAPPPQQAPPYYSQHYAPPPGPYAQQPYPGHPYPQAPPPYYQQPAPYAYPPHPGAQYQQPPPSAGHPPQPAPYYQQPAYGHPSQQAPPPYQQPGYGPPPPQQAPRPQQPAYGHPSQPAPPAPQPTPQLQQSQSFYPNLG